MKIKIKDTVVNYIQYGKDSGKDIILLPGWKQNIEMMDPIGQKLKKDFKITILDFPGFGESDEPSYSWGVEDYFDFFDEFLNELKIKKPILIGHSFGGRIAIIYAAKKAVTKLILIASPFRRTNKKANIKIKILKFLKKVPILNKLENYMKKRIGSRDYKSATPRMREILVKVINNNLINYLSKIKCSTLLIWGTNDLEVPLKEAQYIESVIRDCGLVIYEGGSHYAYLERIDQTGRVLNEFLKNDKE